MTTLRPLAIYPFPPTDADLSLIKAAKAQLDLPYLVVPVRAVPGGPVRVLALRETPDFLCDYAQVTQLDRPESMLAALRWVLDDTLDDKRATLIIDQLRAIFGVEVHEISGYAEDEDGDHFQITDWGHANV